MEKRFHFSVAHRVALSSVVMSMAFSPAAFAQSTAFPTHSLSQMQIYINHTLVARPDGLYATDSDSQKKTTFMPIWYVMQSLKDLDVQSTWNGSVWNLHVPTAMESHLQSQTMTPPEQALCPLKLTAFC